MLDEIIAYLGSRAGYWERKSSYAEAELDELFRRQEPFKQGWIEYARGKADRARREQFKYCNWVSLLSEIRAGRKDGGSQ
jgi:hypothetical protein